VSLWLLYGIIQKDVPIIATNGISLGLNSVMIYLMLKYGKKLEKKGNSTQSEKYMGNE